MTDDLSLRETSCEVSVEWKIKDFFSQPKEIGHELTSPTFRLSDALWYLRVYPNGDDSDDIGWISMFLRRKCSPFSKHCIAFTCGIRSCDGSDHLSKDMKYEFKKNEGYGWGKFIKVSQLSNMKDDLSKNGSLTIFCTARDTALHIIRRENVVEAACQTSSQENPLVRNLKELLSSERHFDTTINVQGRKFRAHKTILVARSPVFASMFDHDMVEKASGAINIDDCDPEYFQDFLQFMYTGKLEIVTSTNAIALYKAAKKYNVEGLKEQCIMCMSHELSADTFCDVVLTAVTHDESKLLNTATNYFIRNLGEIVRSPKWQSFLAEHHVLANELLVKLADKSLTWSKFIYY